MIVRGDIPEGDRGAQTIHAAGESSPGPSLPKDTRAVWLRAKGEADLLALEAELLAAGISHSAIREPDEPYFNALMAIGINPAPKLQLRQYTKRFQTIK